MRILAFTALCLALSGCLPHPPDQEIWTCSYDDINHPGAPTENNRLEIDGDKLIEHKVEAGTKNPYTVAFGVSENTPAILVASRTLFSPTPEPEIVIIEKTTARFRMFDLAARKTGVLPSVGICTKG